MLRDKIRKSELNRRANRETRYYGFDRDDEKKGQTLDLSNILLITCLGLSFAVGIIIGAMFVAKPSATPTYGTSPLVLMVVGKPAFDGTETSVTHEFKGQPNQLYKIEYTSDLTNPWESGETHYSTEDGVFHATFSKKGNQSNKWGKQMFFRLKNSI